MSEPLFLSLDSACLAREIAGAERTVCYAAPGILRKPAVALATLAGKIGPELIAVCLDFDERVIRMGFGTLDAVQTLRVSDVSGTRRSTVCGIRSNTKRTSTRQAWTTT